MSENNEVNTVTIPLEEYIELRQTKQNNMYLCDRFAFIERELENQRLDINEAHQKIKDMQEKLKEFRRHTVSDSVKAVAE